MTEKRKQRDKRISLAPLTTEEALRGLMQAGPHPKDEDQDKEKAPPKGRRPRKKDQVPDA